MVRAGESGGCGVRVGVGVVGFDRYRGGRKRWWEGVERSGGAAW